MFFSQRRGSAQPIRIKHELQILLYIYIPKLLFTTSITEKITYTYLCKLIIITCSLQLKQNYITVILCKKKMISYRRLYISYNSHLFF